MNRNAAGVAVFVIAISACSQLGSNPSPGAVTIAGSAPSAPSPAPSVAAPSEEDTVPQAPVEFTGHIVCGPPVRAGSSESLGVGDEGMVLTRHRGGTWRQTVALSDPRLEGTAYHTFEGDEYRLAGAEAGPGIFAATHRIENEDGAWEGWAIGGAFADGTSIGNEGVEVWVGSGAYSGLIAIMEASQLENACGSDVRGIIFDGGPVPVPYTAK